MPHALDHLLWAAPTLDEGTARFAELSGVTPGRGGAHPGFGTRNALLALGGEAYHSVYLEIIAPDPAQALAGTRGATLAALEAPTLLTYAVRADDLERVARLADGAGLSTPGPVAMSRVRQDGVRLEWRVLHLAGHPFGELLPFFIEWGDTPHPSRSAPGGCTLEAFEVAHPDREALAALYAALEIEVRVASAPSSRLRAALRTPRGEVALDGG